MKTIIAADLFSGAGGTSQGLADVCKTRGLKLRLTAVNHWDRAIESHSANHPGAEHICRSLDSVDPRRVIGKRLDVLCASPECTGHSNAAGGIPRNDQSRATAWHIIRWAEELRPTCILVENVREFLRYGPLGANGRPLKSREGETFHAWLNALESIGYTVSYKLVNSADHGGATSRTRLFIMAVRGRRRATWPTPSHERDPQPGLYDPLPRWRAAREIIDWSLPGKSIFGRKHPLKPNTITRIAEGIRRFWKADPEPFLVVLRGTREDQLRCTARSTTLPLPTITGSGAHLGLIEPFLMHTTHHGNGRVHSIDEPVPTITGANRGEQALIEPFLVTYHNGPDGDRRQQELGRPLPTLDTSNRHGIVQPLIIQQFGSNKTRDVDRPLGVITGTSRGMGLVEPFLIPTNWGEREGQRPRTHDIDSPLPTIVGSPTHGLIEPFLVQYNGESGPQSIDDPLNTIPTRDRFGLVLPGGHVLADILFRMLQPHELASGMGFPIGYKFCGTREDIVKQVGNAVEVNCARALLGELLSLVA